MGGVCKEDPFSACEPDHPPEAVHAVAFALVHVSVAVCPSVIVVGAAESATDTGDGFTVTLVKLLPAPPGPLQVMVKVLGPTVYGVCGEVPAGGSGPGQAPDAMHPVALVADQVILVVCPWLMTAGLAEIVTTGGGVGGVGPTAIAETPNGTPSSYTHEEALGLVLPLNITGNPLALIGNVFAMDPTHMLG